MNRKYTYWICQIGGWTLLYTASFLIGGLNEGYSGALVLNHALSALVGIGVTHAFHVYARGTNWTSLPLRQLSPLVLGATGVLCVLYVGICDLLVLAQVLEPVGMEESEYWTVSRAAYAGFGGSLVMFLWLVLYFGVHSVWNYRQAEVDKWKLEAQAETARLKALKLQLNPHFFFNSLNSVRALIAEDPDRAQRMVTRLARLLRTTLQVDDVKTVPLEDELSTVRTYLELEKVRFEERLQYRIEATTEALSRPVPFLLVQTLVENGIKHGIATRRGGGAIAIDAGVRDTALHLRVTNPGTVTSEEGGVGLANARERLRLLFGDEASLTLQNEDPETVEARVVLPIRDRPERPPGLASSSAEEKISV